VIKIKICGITNLEDAQVAVAAGADALGFVFYEKSPRNITPQKAAAIIAQLPPFIQTIGLFVDEDEARVNWTADFCGLDLVQLHGDEPPEYCLDIRRRVIKAFRVKDGGSLGMIGTYQVAGYLLDAWSPDAPGGTGLTFDWSLARRVAGAKPIILAGGLSPENVAVAIAAVSPYAVDVSSGVEAAPGKKDHQKVQAFIAAVRTANERH